MPPIRIKLDVPISHKKKREIQERSNLLKDVEAKKTGIISAISVARFFGGVDVRKTIDFAIVLVMTKYDFSCWGLGLFGVCCLIVCCLAFVAVRRCLSFVVFFFY